MFSNCRMIKTDQNTELPLTVCKKCSFNVNAFVSVIV